MKNILIFGLFLLAGCTPVSRFHKYVDVTNYRTWRHAPKVYTIPVWIPQRGIILENRIYHPQRFQGNRKRH